MKHAFALTALTLTAALTAPQAHAGPTLDPIFTFESPSADPDDSFGISVALNQEFAVVGAQLDSTNGLFNGRAYVFDPTTGDLTNVLVNPDRTTRDGFGAKVFIDGGLIAVGAPFSDIDPSGTFGDNVGRGYVFDANTGSLIRRFNSPLSQISGQFGEEIELNEGRALIGAPRQDIGGNTNEGRAYLYDVISGSLLRTFSDPTPTATDLFGFDTALRGDLALIAAPFDNSEGNNTGQVHLFNTQTGELLHTFRDPSPSDNNNFGISVDLGDGFALIAADDGQDSGDSVGRVFLYDTATGELLRTFEETSPGTSGNSSDSLSFDGDFLLVSNVTSNQVDLFRISTGELLHSFTDPDPLLGSFFGGSVAIENNQVLIGTGFSATSGDRGRAYLYDISSLTAPTQVPLPATLALLGMGLLGVGVMRRRIIA